MTSAEEKAQCLKREHNRRFYEYLLSGLAEERSAQVKADAIRLHSLGYSWEEAGLEAVDPALFRMAKQGIPLIGVYDSKAFIARKEDIADAYTTDPAEIASLMQGKGDRQGRAKGVKIRRFSFIPKDAGLLCLDIDRKPGKRDGLQELYKLFPPDTLPEELRDIEHCFPCYVSTPSGGYHLYFKYTGDLIRKTDLCPEVEVKHGSPGLTAPGSVNAEGKPYISSRGEPRNAPPLNWFILERIIGLQNRKQEQRRIPTYPTRSLTVRNIGVSKQQTTLDTLADEAVNQCGGHHDRQVSFAGKAYRCRFSVTDTLAYVQANPGVFGNGSDTCGTIESVFKANGGL